MLLFSLYKKLCRLPRLSKKNCIGQYGELLTCVYLWSSGYKILRRNYGSPLGEIDILATKKHYLYVIEVKYRKSLDKTNWPHHPQQRQRQLKQLQVFLKNYPAYQSCPIYLALAIVRPLQIPKFVIYS